MIHDPDNAGVNRSFDGIERKTRFLAPDEEHFFTDARADGVDGDERASGGFALRGERLDDEQLDADQVLVFSRGDDIADDFCDLHVRVPGSRFRVQGSLSSMLSMTPTMA